MSHSACETYEAVLDAPFFEGSVSLGITLQGSALSGIDFLPPHSTVVSPSTELGRLVVAQLLAYFDDPGYCFSLPLAPRGTPFQHSVWQALRALAPGETRGYGELAQQLDTAPRAIGNACKSNAIPIIIPCHRVLAAKGLGGYCGAVSGPRLAIKQKLLAHERQAQRHV